MSEIVYLEPYRLEYCQLQLQFEGMALDRNVQIVALKKCLRKLLEISQPPQCLDEYWMILIRIPKCDLLLQLPSLLSPHVLNPCSVFINLLKLTGKHLTFSSRISSSILLMMHLLKESTATSSEQGLSFLLMYWDSYRHFGVFDSVIYF